MRIRLWRSSPEGHREVSEGEARRIEREGRSAEPQGPTGVVSSGWCPDGEWLGGPTGAVPMIEHVESKGKPDEIRTGYGTTVGLTGAQGPAFVGFRDGEWYAFRLYRLGDDDDLAEPFYARVHSDGTTGFLELREIPDPWACWKCGLGYQEGAHTEFGFDGPDAHDYTARGAPSC